MRRLFTCLSVAAFGALSMAANALVVDITAVTEFIVDVDSTNSHSGKFLTYELSQDINTGIVPSATETNISGGLQQLLFLDPPGANGTYDFSYPTADSFFYTINFTETGACGDSVDLSIGFHLINTPPTSGVTVSGASVGNPQGNRSGGVSMIIDSIDGDSTLGAFSTGEPAIVHTFTFCGVPITLELRQTQSPSVSATATTAVEGRIVSVPEPGSVALLLSTGVCGSLLVLRRRRR